MTIEKADWLGKESPTFLQSIRRLRKSFSLLVDGVLFDGALVSECKSPLVVPVSTKGKFSLEGVEPLGDEENRFFAYNPGMKKITKFSSFAFPSGYNIALANESGSFSNGNAVEAGNHGFFRSVSWGEALRYIGVPDHDTLIESAKRESDEMRKILEGEVYQVTKQGSERVKLVMKEMDFSHHSRPPGGSGSLRKRILLPA